MQDLEVALIQFDISWHNPKANRKAVESKINSLNSAVDLIILPEMFTTGFTMAVHKYAEPTEGETLNWMKKMAAKTNAVITGSIIINEGEHYFNRLLWVTPNGAYSHYDKRHLFRMADEHSHFAQGNKHPIFELNGWKFKPQICYDLRFPVWSRNVNLAYDVLIYIANWPAARVLAWDTLLQARAIENLCYCIGVNRVGIDGTGKEYNGHSACYNFKGNALNELSETEEVTYVSLSKLDLVNHRVSFPTNLDADLFNIHYLT
ncbi:MAG: amidohydrolase [Cyclobacteriaceae bacterium]|nr:amidohydrolase [Cyclobacteriaceae bacterium]